jgi:hypothetical protein
MRPALLLAIFAASGCSEGLRFSTGATVDTLGHVGGEAHLSIAFGVVVARLNLEAGGGIQRAPDALHAVHHFGAGIEGFVPFRTRLVAALGLDFVARFVSDDDGRLDGFGLGTHVTLHRVFSKDMPNFPGYVFDQWWGIGGEVSTFAFFTEDTRYAVFFLGPSIAGFARLYP